MNADAAGGRGPWNVPNTLTLLRLIAACVLFALLEWKQYRTAFFVFLAAAGTDWIDGWWARKFNQITVFGRIFDPFVDKVLICGSVVYLAAASNSGVPAWFAVLVVARELLVTALRGHVEASGGDFSASSAGKWKMVAQCGVVLFALIVLHVVAKSGGGDTSGSTLAGMARVFRDAALWVAAVLTVYSGAEYVVAAVRFGRGKSA